MIYEKLIYENERGESLALGVGCIYWCNVSKDVDGISGVKNTVYKTNSMGQHGDTYVGQRIEARPIDIAGTIKETDKERAHELRRKMVKILNPELEGTLIYEFGDIRKRIKCRMSGQPKFFRKSVFTQFSFGLDCLNPFWLDMVETKQDIASWIPLFEFELEIPDDEGIEFARREPSLIVDVYNEGDVKTGMRIEFRAMATLHNPMLINVNTREFIKVNREMKAGDVIVVNTEYGKKGAKLTRDGVTRDCYRSLDEETTFMQLDIGDNIFRYDADDGLDMLEVSIYHGDGYLGV